MQVVGCVDGAHKHTLVDASIEAADNLPVSGSFTLGVGSSISKSFGKCCPSSGKFYLPVSIVVYKSIQQVASFQPYLTATATVTHIHIQA